MLSFGVQTNYYHVIDIVQICVVVSRIDFNELVYRLYDFHQNLKEQKQKDQNIIM